MYAHIEFERLTRASGIDWNYRITGTVCKFTFELPRKDIIIPEGKCFQNEWMHLYRAGTVGGVTETVTLELTIGYAWDGASVVPDFVGIPESTAVHDPIYQFADAIAKAFGCSVSQVLRFADMLFNMAMDYFKVKPIIRKTYYKGVSWFGYIFNRFNHWRSS